MPLLRKLTNGNHSRFITLPKEWLDYHEEENGEFTEVEITVNDVLTIRPHHPKKKAENQGDGSVL